MSTKYVSNIFKAEVESPSESGRSIVADIEWFLSGNYFFQSLFLTKLVISFLLFLCGFSFHCNKFRKRGQPFRMF